MINIRKLNGNDLSNYYTKSQCDSKFLPRMDLSTIINDLENQITTLENNTNTHLTTLDGIVSSQNTQINDLNNFSTLIDLNLYEPLLNSGDTKINNLSGLTSLINNSIPSLTSIESQISTLNNNTSLFNDSVYLPLVINGDTRINNLYGLTSYVQNAISNGTQINPLNNLSLDPFYAVGNFNTTLSLSHVINFSHMVLNNVNTNNNFYMLRNISFGNAIFQNQSTFGGSGAVSNTSIVSRSCRMFDFHLDLSNINSFNSNNNAVMLFVPDTILNLYDGFIYKLNFITNKPSVTKYNNHNIPNLYLLFRNHITMSNSMFQNLFLAGTESASASKLHLCFLSKIKLLYSTTQYEPTITVHRVYMKPSSRLWNRCNGLMITNLYYIPPTDNGNLYNLDVCLSLYGDYEKTVTNLYLPNPDIYNYGSFVTVSGNTTWKQYYTQESTMDHYTHNVPILLGNDESFDVWFQYLNSLCN